MAELEDAEDQEHKKKKRKKKAEMEKKRNTGMIIMYRTAARNHVAYIAIGDRRANILIGTCTLIISIGFTVFLSKFEDLVVYLFPGIILIVTCTATMILAIFSTRPDSTKGYHSLEEIMNKEVNLLHFENFHKMTLLEYEVALDKLIESGNDSRHALMHDLHSLGVSVARKYRYLRLSYNVLMIGVVIAVLASFISLYLHTH
jgi:hypothetical protein